MLFHEGAGAEAMHFVRAGTFKIFRTAEDGYEQVLGFAGRGEVMGFDAISAGTHPTAAMALEDSSVFVVLLCDFFSLGQRISALDTLVHRAVSGALANRAELADVMAAVAAEVRLARFLLQLSQRMAACGQSPRRFHLRMSRRDIASYLGVAHETVSRRSAPVHGLCCRWKPRSRSAGHARPEGLCAEHAPPSRRRHRRILCAGANLDPTARTRKCPDATGVCGSLQSGPSETGPQRKAPMTRKPSTPTPKPRGQPAARRAPATPPAASAGTR